MIRDLACWTRLRDPLNRRRVSAFDRRWGVHVWGASACTAPLFPPIPQVRNRRVKTLLLMNPDLTGGFDLEKLKPLGSRADVDRRIKGVFGSRLPAKLEIGTEDPVRQISIALPTEASAAFDALRRLCDQTGWRLFDRDAGRFLDLASAKPLSKPMAPPPMFQWWTGLPSAVRVLVGLAVAFMLFYILVLDWVLSWH